MMHILNSTESDLTEARNAMRRCTDRVASRTDRLHAPLAVGTIMHFNEPRCSAGVVRRGLT